MDSSPGSGITSRKTSIIGAWAHPLGLKLFPLEPLSMPHGLIPWVFNHFPKTFIIGAWAHPFCSGIISRKTFIIGAWAHPLGLELFPAKPFSLAHGLIP